MMFFLLSEKVSGRQEVGLRGAPPTHFQGARLALQVADCALGALLAVTALSAVVTLAGVPVFPFGALSKGVVGMVGAAAGVTLIALVIADVVAHRRIQREERAGAQGITNIGNSCYANALVQMLMPLLTYFFSESGCEEKWRKERKNPYLYEELARKIGAKNPFLESFKTSLETGKEVENIPEAVRGAYEEVKKEGLLQEELFALLAEIQREYASGEDISAQIEELLRCLAKETTDIELYEQADPATAFFFLVRVVGLCDRCVETRTEPAEGSPERDLGADPYRRTWESLWEVGIPEPQTSSFFPLFQDKRALSFSTLLQQDPREAVDIEYTAKAVDGGESAQVKARCTKYERVVSAPPDYLAVRIKRFDKDLRKISTPLALDVKKPIDITTLFAEEALQGATAYYKVVGVARHEGWLCFGHYTALSLRGEEWYMLNDKSSRQITDLQEVNKYAADGYLFLLQKVERKK